jgi:hypothetical protein
VEQQEFTEKPLQRFIMDVAFGLCICLFVFFFHLVEIKKLEMKKINDASMTTPTP